MRRLRNKVKRRKTEFNPKEFSVKKAKKIRRDEHLHIWLQHLYKRLTAASVNSYQVLIALTKRGEKQKYGAEMCDGDTAELKLKKKSKN